MSESAGGSSVAQPGLLHKKVSCDGESLFDDFSQLLSDSLSSEKVSYFGCIS